VNMDSSCRNLAFVAEWWWWSGPQLARHACCTKLMRWWSGFQAPLHNSVSWRSCILDGPWDRCYDVGVMMQGSISYALLEKETIHWGTENFSSLNCVFGHLSHLCL
jgi:hypothetical protein